ncbi:SAM-dependent methyltransferase [Mycobacterium sp. CVI_P3]|uniref:S-adenosyl-L-methionine-dependent methyltransferase n=1 Tax=Mycobacterium pinniadriaticum TaxID=2994102 RepID=A0ABT3SQI8_9MYCO|nr:SAM-dependent methyltransferase [Mycobacterium pinniadriaticum]MCX2934685.1 SAM-dependent methyltransferase [Mycobacterium pinniadriaticum]MCX2941107.1 SAM-dependent methyltransferase [Mycobacterium pinniadriaticum]
MARTDGDTWDLASGVGATATAVAASRALAHRANLIDDPWAEPLVKAVGMEMFLRILDGHIAGDHTETDLQRMAQGMAVRTRYFDDFLIEAAADGIRQAVILASGLDTRSYRLAWPADTTVFEIDQPGVIDFKTSTLRGLGATPTAGLHTVGVDLREDWPGALRASGFDPARPTAWIAEGLLIYLPPEAQDRLFDHITALSPVGSRLATEFMPSMGAFTGETDDADRDGQERWRKLGFHDDLADLVYHGERSHVIDYLGVLGWRVTGDLVQELFETNGFESNDDEMTEQFSGFQYISATLS